MFEWLKNIFSHEKHEADNDASRDRMDKEHIRENKKESSPIESPPKNQNE